MNLSNLRILFCTSIGLSFSKYMVLEAAGIRTPTESHVREPFSTGAVNSPVIFIFPSSAPVSCM